MWCGMSLKLAPNFFWALYEPGCPKLYSALKSPGRIRETPHTPAALAAFPPDPYPAYFTSEAYGACGTGGIA